MPKLLKTMGHGMGIELREGGTILNSKATGTFKAGMVFNLSIGEPADACRSFICSRLVTDGPPTGA